MKRFVGVLFILFILLLLSSFISCNWGDGRAVFDFVADPLAPPIPHQEGGSYDYPIMTGLEPGGWDSGMAYYTLNPELPMAMDESWNSYLWQEDYKNPPIVIQSPATLRIFCARNEYDFSAVVSHDFFFTSPVPKLSPEPGAQDMPTNIGAEIHDLQLAVVDATGTWITQSQGMPDIYYSYSKSLAVEPVDPDPASWIGGLPWTGPGDTLRWTDASVKPFIDATNQEIWVKIMTRIRPDLRSPVDLFPGWTDSPIVEGKYWIDWPSVGIGISILAPDGTISLLGAYSSPTIDFDGWDSTYPSDFSFSCANPNLTGWTWFLNGYEVLSGSRTITIGSSGPAAYPDWSATSPNLPSGSYEVTCVASDAAGFIYSQSITLAVLP